MTVLNLAYNKNKQHKSLFDYWFRDMLNFDFLEKGLGIVSPPHFVYDFLRKMFFMLYSINWPNFISWLPLLLEILVNMCITIVCKAYSESLLHVTIACNHLTFFKHFSNFVHFCTVFQIFSPFSEKSNLCPYFPEYALVC